MNTDQLNYFLHQLWLIYLKLKDAEADFEQRLELLERSRQELGEVLNYLYKQFDLLPDKDTLIVKRDFAPGLLDRQT